MEEPGNIGITLLPGFVRPNFIAPVGHRFSAMSVTQMRGSYCVHYSLLCFRLPGRARVLTLLIILYTVKGDIGGKMTDIAGTTVTRPGR